MYYNNSTARKAFISFNYLILTVAALITIFPMLHILALSLSEGWAVQSGMVGIWPVKFTLKAYEFVALNSEFMRAFFITIERVLIGVPLNMILTVLIAYPLSKKKSEFKYRNMYAWFFIITMMFNGGMIPTYVVVYKTGLINSIWSLIIPGAVQVFNVIIMFNFFRELPSEIEESAFIDGASYWRSLWSIYIPLSKPVLATVILFFLIGHWNSWFDGILYINRPEKYPLQSYLQTVVIQIDIKVSADLQENFAALQVISQRNTRAAKIFLAMIPILLVYPFLQKYFTTGIVLGSVKG